MRLFSHCVSLLLTYFVSVGQSFPGPLQSQDFVPGEIIVKLKDPKDLGVRFSNTTGMITSLDSAKILNLLKGDRETELEYIFEPKVDLMAFEKASAGGVRAGIAGNYRVTINK